MLKSVFNSPPADTTFVDLLGSASQSSRKLSSMVGSLESLSEVLKSDSKSASSLFACVADNAKLAAWKDDSGEVRKVRMTESALSTFPTLVARYSTSLQTTICFRFMVAPGVLKLRLGARSASVDF